MFLVASSALDETSKAPIPDSIKKIIQDFICKGLENGSSKDEVVAAVCKKLHSEFKLLPEGACERTAKLLWEHLDLSKCKPTVKKAAELRRWDGSTNCTGKYTVLNRDNMNECTPKYIPEPASYWIVQKNESAYSSYHCEGVIDCSGKDKCELFGYFIVGTCEDLGGYSQKRVWISAESKLTANTQAKAKATTYANVKVEARAKATVIV